MQLREVHLVCNLQRSTYFFPIPGESPVDPYHCYSTGWLDWGLGDPQNFSSDPSCLGKPLREHSFFLFPSQNALLVLGISWLWVHNPHIDRTRGRVVTWSSHCHSCTFGPERHHGEEPLPAPVISLGTRTHSEVDRIFKKLDLRNVCHLIRHLVNPGAPL